MKNAMIGKRCACPTIANQPLEKAAVVGQALRLPVVSVV